MVPLACSEETVFMEDITHTIPNQKIDENIIGRGPKSPDQRDLKTRPSDPTEKHATKSPGLPISSSATCFSRVCLQCRLRSV